MAASEHQPFGAIGGIRALLIFISSISLVVSSHQSFNYSLDRLTAWPGDFYWNLVGIF